jgi:hypothetical protein
VFEYHQEKEPLSGRALGPWRSAILVNVGKRADEALIVLPIENKGKSGKLMVC